MKNVLAAFFFSVFLLPAGAKAQHYKDSVVKRPRPVTHTFTNPLLPAGADPWVTRKDGYYYFLSTAGNRIDIRKTAKMSNLGEAPAITVWRPAQGTPGSYNVWAPELHFIGDKWYLYYTAGDARDLGTQRLHVLMNESRDPLQGQWIDKGRLADPDADFFAIDGTTFEYKGQQYLLWSGHPSASDNTQCLYIVRMENPWTMSTHRVRISIPTYGWEKVGAPPAVNEGPEILKNKDGRVFLVFSASGCWTDDYKLGLIALKAGGNPLEAADWTKYPEPVFTKSAGAFGPGHNGFFTSPDGKEDWIIYHANPLTGEGCGGNRSARMQPIHWRADGTPDFGRPVQADVPIAAPSGE